MTRTQRSEIDEGRQSEEVSIHQIASLMEGRQLEEAEHPSPTSRRPGRVGSLPTRGHPGRTLCEKRPGPATADPAKPARLKSSYLVPNHYATHASSRMFSALDLKIQQDRGVSGSIPPGAHQQAGFRRGSGDSRPENRRHLRPGPVHNDGAGTDWGLMRGGWGHSTEPGDHSFVG